MANQSSSRPSPGPSAHSPSDAFSLLGLAPQFSLDAADIERAFLERSKQVHPDRFATAPASERVAALSQARALNDAYQVVKKPVARAEYLLARSGVTIGDNERLDPQSIAEILELREELESARQRNDRTALDALHRQMQARRVQAVAELAPLFAAHDLQAIKRVLIALRYIDRYLEAADAALSED